MVALSLLLPLLAPTSDLPTLLATLSTLHIHADAELLFTSRQLPPELEALRPKIQTFLAAEGRAASLVYAADVEREERKLGVTTGCRGIDERLLDGGFRGGDVVELVGSDDSGKTFFALQTVLRHLVTHPSAYALWLDTTSTFSAELAVKMLETFAESTPDIHTSNGAPILPPLDRLIVAKTFNSSSAIQAIQTVRNNGFPRQRQGRSESERKEDKPVSDLSEAKVDEAMQVDTIHEATELPSLQDAKERTEEAKKPSDASVDDKKEMHLTFIVIDSINVLFRNILSGVTTEGHAKMVSFMRLLRSLSHLTPLVTLLTNSTTTSAFPTGLPSFNSLSLVKPSLGPSFGYLCDWTLWIGGVQEVFPNERNENGEGKVMEVWRSRRALGNRWVAYRTDGVRFLE